MLVKTTLIAHSLFGALAANTPPAATPQVAGVPAERVLEVGEATWYHRQRAPNITASGVRFDPRGMTAAHRSIRLGTVVRVTDRDSGRSVVVTVNDREPPHGVRCIDLSEGAAMALGIHHEGVARVTISAVTGESLIAAAPEPPVTEVAEAPDPSAPGALPTARHVAVRTRRPVVHKRN